MKDPFGMLSAGGLGRSSAHASNYAYVVLVRMRRFNTNVMPVKLLRIGSSERLVEALLLSHST